MFLFNTDKDYNEAIELYTAAVDLNPFIAAYYGNRSFAYLKTECFGYALVDADKALQLDKSYVKVRLFIIGCCHLVPAAMQGWVQLRNCNYN